MLCPLSTERCWGGQAAGKQKGGFVLGGVGNRAEGLREPVPTENSTWGRFLLLFFFKKNLETLGLSVPTSAQSICLAFCGCL